MARRDDDPGLPIKLHPCSNGEFVPPPATPVVREAVRRARDQADENARRLGWSRRRFLRSSMGAATTLAALAACSNEAAQSSSPGSTAGGTYAIAPEATTEPEAAKDAVGGEEFIMDVQTHFLDQNHDVPNLGVGFPQNACGEQDARDCFTVDKYLDLLFNQSDTNMIVISALPFAGSPLDSEVMIKTIDLADRLCGEQRTLMQGEAHPSLGPPQGFLDNMAELKRTLPIGAWKVYTHAGGPGWFLDDHDPAAPQIGQTFIDQVRALGPKTIAVHKGFAAIGGDARFADPVDIGPAAAANPDVNFVVYHSGFDVGNVERAYDEADAYGVNRLITSVRGAGIEPGGNVYAEIGSTWRALMGDTTRAAHVIGKLLVAFGEDNVVWGTDSIWYGSPQDQIQAFRAFEISPELQERFGYPQLTPAIKAKVFGLTSARLYDVDPIRERCVIDRDQIENARLASLDGNVTYGPRTADEVYAVARAELAQYANFS